MRKCCRNAFKMLLQLFWGGNNAWCGQRTTEENTLEVYTCCLQQFILVVINNLVGVLIFILATFYSSKLFNNKCVKCVIRQFTRWSVERTIVTWDHSIFYHMALGNNLSIVFSMMGGLNRWLDMILIGW